MRAHPQTRTRLLIGDDVLCDNPKLNNLVKGWRAARTDRIVMADSNVDMPADYIQRLLATWRADAGLVCSPAVGGAPESFAAELECAFLNTYQARWQYAVDSLGFGFAQGKTMLIRRALLERAGGIEALSADLAEDAAATKLVRAAGLRVRLVDAPFLQPLGPRGLRAVWSRQVRWARLRRASFGSYFAAEILTSGLVPIALAAATARGYALPLAIVPATAAVWYGAEAVLAHAARWPLTVRSPLAFMLRDLLLPAIWISGWIDTRFVWRGHAMSAAAPRGT
jgi:ceramide glucosyltransferase